MSKGYHLKATEETWRKGTSELVHILQVSPVDPIYRYHRYAVLSSDTFIQIASLAVKSIRDIRVFRLWRNLCQNYPCF